MAQTAFSRDNVLSPDERVASARKCLQLLTPETGDMTDREVTFVSDMVNKIDMYGCSERQLSWLRDLVEKYSC